VHVHNSNESSLSSTLSFLFSPFPRALLEDDARSASNDAFIGTSFLALNMRMFFIRFARHVSNEE
jgi:hypothetical protein